MTSLGEDAYCGTLTLDRLNYTILDPPIGGFVNNPLTGTLDCGGNNLTNAGTITTGTLNYTTLNPPIPTGFVNNPMTVNLGGGNFNIDNINSFKSATVETTGKIQSDLEVISLGKLEGANGEVFGNWEVGGNLTVDTPGTTELKGPTELKGATTDVLNFREVSYKAPAPYGTKAVPIVITIGGAGTALSFDMLGDNRSVLIYGVPSGTGLNVSFDIFTDIVDVLDHYVVQADFVHIIVDTLNAAVEAFEITPTLITGPPDSKKFNVRFLLSKQALTNDVYKIAVRLIKTD
jgi:hypothetical protein